MTTAGNPVTGQKPHAPRMPADPVEVTVVEGAANGHAHVAHAERQLTIAMTLGSDGAVLHRTSGAADAPGTDQRGMLWECACFPSHARRKVRSAFTRAGKGEAVSVRVPLQLSKTVEVLGSLQIAPVAEDGRPPERFAAFITAPAAPSEGGAAEPGVSSDRERIFFAHIVDSTDDAVVSKTLDGDITSWNRAAERIFGYSAEEAIGKHISLVIPPDRLDEERDILARLRRGERVDHYETDRMRRDGTRIRVSLTISPMRDSAGRVVGACKIARDVTQRHIDEAALARRMAQQASLYAFTDRLQRVRSIEEVYSAALDAITEALGCERASILQLDGHGVMRFVHALGLSDAYQKAVEGHSPWAIDQQDPQPVCIADVTRTELEPDVRRALESEGIGSLAFVPLTRDGRLVGKFMVYYDRPHEFIADEVELSVLIARQLTFNIDRLTAETRRSLAERAMRESEARFTRFMTHLPGLAWIKDARGRYVYANQAAFEAFGVSAQALYGKTDAEIFPPQTAATFMRHDRQAMEIDSGTQVVETLERFDKQLHHSLVNKFRIPGFEPGSDLIGGMAIDITAMKRAEDALRTREGQYRDLSSRLTLLLRSTSRLIETLKTDEMLGSVLSLSRELIAADAFGLWRLDTDPEGGGGQWRLVASEGLSDEFVGGALPRGNGERVPRQAIVVQPEDLARQDTPILEGRWGAYRREGIRSLMIIPLRIRGEVSGTLVFYCRRPHVFSEIEVESASAMANITAAAITTTELYEAESRLRESAQAAARREAFLAAAGAALSESFDPEHSLGSVATAAVPRFADWCCVDLLDESGRLERLVDVHVDPRHAVLARQMREKYPPDERAGAGVHQVMLSAAPELLSSLPDSLLEKAAQSEEHLQWLRELRLQSQISIPLFSGGVVCGTMSFVTSLSNRRYDESDLAIAEEVARRASQALDNSRLYRDLAESEMQLRLAMEAGRMGSWEWRIDTNEVIWSASLEEMHGLEPGTFEQTYEAFERDIHPGDAERVRDTISRALETGELPSIEYRAILPDGSERWFEGRGRLFHDEEGRPVRMIGVCTDITARRAADEAIRESESRFRLMADAAPVLIWVSDENKRGIYFNDTWLKFTGRTHEQECGEGWIEGIHPDDLEATARACRSAFNQQIPFRIEFRMRRADGEYRWVLDHGVPRFTEDGRLTGYIGSCIDVTDHKEAEEALRQSECRYRAVVEGQAEMICRFNPEGEILFVNDAYGRARGQDAAALQGTDFWRWIHVDDREQVRTMLDRLRPDAPEISIENRIGEGDDARWTLWRNRALSFDEHGRATEVQSSGIDISDRKRAEFALRESEQRFRELANGIDQFVWTCNPLGEATWYNQRWYDFTGTSFEEMRGDGWKKVHHPDHVQRVSEGLNRAIDAGEPWEDVFPLRGRDGHYRWFLSRAVPIRDRLGRVVRWLGTNTDVTEQRQAETALKAKELELELITSSTPLILCRCSSDRRYRFVNQAAASLFGVPPEQIVGRPIADVMGQEAFELISPYIDRVLRGEQVEFELEIPYTAAGPRWMRVNYIPDRDEDGGVIGWIASIVDFTEQKRVEAALKQSHENLERRVAERTSELQRRADQLARLTSELTLTERRERERLAKILHDHLQQLLASGKLGLEFIARSNDEKRRSEWIDHARTCVDEAIEASRSLSVELCPPVLQEGGLAAGCEWLARRMKERHGLDVRLSVDADADPDREDVRTLVFESIRELLFNTTKHARVKEASLELAVHDEDYLRVIIEDKGAGFDADKLLHSREHVGFGLFNIRERLAMLGGTFKIESQVGKGSRFTVVAPRHGRSAIRAPLSDMPETRTGKVSKLSARRRAKAKNRIRVVVVDDHAVMRQGLCSLLAEEPNLEVVGEARDGIEAVEQARRLVPDVILMDYSLPGMNGVEAAHAIRREFPEVQVIALSMHREKERAEAMTAAGAVAYFNKSDDSDALIEAIARYGSRSNDT